MTLTTGLRNNERLIAFLDDANVNVLSASVEKMSDGSVKYHIDNVTHVGKANDRVLVLFKVSDESAVALCNKIR